MNKELIYQPNNMIIKKHHTDNKGLKNSRHPDQ